MNLINKSDKLRIQRKDLSPYLFHFTNGNNPCDNMNSILNQCCLKSTKHNYICFTEAPVTSNIALLEYMQNRYSTRAMYSQWGIGFSRDILYSQYKARNVIYGTEEDSYFIAPELHWRFEPMNIEEHDFSWLREWRIEGNSFDFSEFPKEHIIIVAPTKEELLSIIGDEDIDIEFEYEHEIGDCVPYVNQTNKRVWKGFSIDELTQMSNDFSVSGATTNQIFGENIGFQ